MELYLHSPNQSSWHGAQLKAWGLYFYLFKTLQGNYIQITILIIYKVNSRMVTVPKLIYVSLEVSNIYIPFLLS